MNEYEQDPIKWFRRAIESAKDGSVIHIPAGHYVISNHKAKEYSDETQEAGK